MLTTLIKIAMFPISKLTGNQNDTPPEASKDCCKEGNEAEDAKEVHDRNLVYLSW